MRPLTRTASLLAALIPCPMPPPVSRQTELPVIATFRFERTVTPFGRAAVSVLMALTGKETKMPNEANKAAIKAEWEALLK